MLSLNVEWRDATDIFKEWAEKVTASLMLKRERLNQPGHPQLVASIQRTWLIQNEYRIELGDGVSTATVRESESLRARY
jgi:hypothetical protein